MKKILALMGVLLVLSSVACGNNDSDNKVDKAAEKSSKIISETKEVTEKTMPITKFNEYGVIKDNTGNIVYKFKVDSITDVTKTASDDMIYRIGGVDRLSYFSNDIGKQAIKIQITMINHSGQNRAAILVATNLVQDQSNENAVGGWVETNGRADAFDQLSDTIANIKDGQTGTGVTYFALKNVSSKIKLTIGSETYNKKLLFELPVQR
ncbi:hypothetical protein [Paenilisteria newyorkensis]|uniref:hypothetical protein n=1 Tax=Listeria newyorkensis TaxID=1497681 RepID=UPI00235935D6|nr:hypothetical protein [Listeria newyorkensis]WAO22076.1 hypothetical protein OTR81_01935 [Listeria newyorkensis]